MWKITYYDINKKSRVWYLNTGFDFKQEGMDEIKRLKLTQKYYDKIHHPRTKKDFKVEKISQ